MTNEKSTEKATEVKNEVKGTTQVAETTKTTKGETTKTAPAKESGKKPVEKSMKIKAKETPAKEVKSSPTPESPAKGETTTKSPKKVSGTKKSTKETAKENLGKRIFPENISIKGVGKLSIAKDIPDFKALLALADDNGTLFNEYYVAVLYTKADVKYYAEQCGVEAYPKEVADVNIPKSVPNDLDVSAILSISDKWSRITIESIYTDCDGHLACDKENDDFEEILIFNKYNTQEVCRKSYATLWQLYHLDEVDDTDYSQDVPEEEGEEE